MSGSKSTCFLSIPFESSRLRGSTLPDFNRRARLRQVEQAEHVVVPEPDAAAAGRGADARLVVGAVEVDVAGLGVGVVGLDPLQPQDAGEDEILVVPVIRL